jgi:DNA invertase Pin-like site-specific DNA recombinase
MSSTETNSAPRVALYSRVSSDLQSAASLDDQLRICAEWAAKQGLLVVGSYTDQALSGASLIRPGIQKLLQDAAAGKFDVILTESLDRLSRDQEDIAHIHKRLHFQGVGIVTLAEGETISMSGSRGP